MAHNHSKTTCTECGIVISQCRCMAEKEDKYAICSECLQKPNNQGE